MQNSTHRFLKSFIFFTISFTAIAARAQFGITGNTIVCPGSTTTLTATGNSPFTWYNTATGGTALHTGATFTTPAINGDTTYWVSSNGSARIPVSLTIAQVPDTTVASPSTICLGSSSALTVRDAIQSIKWYNAASGGSQLDSVGPTGIFTVSPAITTTYYASLNPIADTVTFGLTGDVQTFTVPAGVTSILVDASGGRGGNSYEAAGYYQPGGLGGRVQATLNVSPGQVLYIYVGQRGYGTPNCEPCTAVGPAYNGGGANAGGDDYASSGGGGGATDIRVNGQSLTNRVLVAGGGGGGAGVSGAGGGGGAGGGVTGAAGGQSNVENNIAAKGGSQSAGGSAGDQNGYYGGTGSLGTGGDAGNWSGQFGGGGGGGYYGGGGGIAAGGGGGGSSYADSALCQNVVHTQGYNGGDGQLTIIYNYVASCSVRLPDTVAVTPNTTAITISTGVGNLICRGTTVVFTGTGVNAGTSQAYQWYKNNAAVGKNAATYSDNALKNGDSVWCFITTNTTACMYATKSNEVKMQVNALPVVNTLPNQTIPNGSAVSASFTGTASNYTWVNNNPGIGLAASGSGNIGSFTVVNTGTVADTALITVTPVTDPLAYIGNLQTNAVSVVDPITGALVTSIPVGQLPATVLVSPDGSRAYVGNVNDNTISVINTSTNAVIATIPVGSSPEPLAISSDGGTLYVSNISSPSVSVIKTATNSVTNTIANGQTIYGIGISPNGSSLYTASDQGYVQILNASTYAVTASIYLGGTLGNIAVSPDGTKIYVNNFSSNNVAVINTSTNTLITTVPVDGQQDAIAISNDGSSVYVANNAVPTVSVINTATNSVASTINFSFYPSGISLTADGKNLVVTGNQYPSGIEVVNTSNNAVRTISVSGDPEGVGSFVTGAPGCAGTPATFAIIAIPAPVINSFNPVEGSIGFTDTIKGHYFTGATAVSFGGTAATSFTVVSDSVIAAVVGSGTTGTVSVTTSAGTGTLAGFAICTPGNWTGTADSSWSNAANWCDGTIPSSTTSVNIPAGTPFSPVINGAATTGNITVASGATLVINQSGLLTISGASIDINGTLSGAAGSLVFNGTGVQNISGSISVNNLTIDGNVEIKSGTTTLYGVLTVLKDNLNVEGSLVLASTSVGTASVAQSSLANYVKGNVIVERYIPAHRAWRFLTAPVSRAGSIYNNWQNKGVITDSTGALMFAPDGTGSSGNGLTQGGGAASIENFDPVANNWVSLTNTTTNLLSGTTTTAANKAFGLFVTGPYGSGNITTSSAATTLLATGQLQTGTQSFKYTGLSTGAYILVGNPYASPVAFTHIGATGASSGNILNTMWAWDAQRKGTTLGGYVTFSWDAAAGAYDQDIDTTQTAQTMNIQSGEAIFVEANTSGTSTVTFNETDKSAPSTITGAVFGLGSPAQQLRIALNRSINSVMQPVDGVLVKLGNNYNAGVGDDANKLYNYDEGFALRIDTSYLGIERRPVPSLNDTLFLDIYALKHNTNYSFTINPQNVNLAEGIQPYLVDNYLNTKTPISFGSANTVSFNTTSVAGSYGETRFIIVFSQTQALATTITNVKAWAKDKGVQVQWSVATEQGIREYVVEKSADGITFVQADTTATINNNQNQTYDWFDANPFDGNNYYRIKIINKDGSSYYSNTVMVNIKLAITFKAYPNPLPHGEQLRIEIGGMPAGKYTLQIFSNDGRQVMQKILLSDGNTSTQNINLPPLAAGVYQVILIDETGKEWKEKLIVN